MLVLYEFGNSVCCQKVRLVLFEKGLAWESRQINLFCSEQYEPEYLKLNPKGPGADAGARRPACHVDERPGEFVGDERKIVKDHKTSESRTIRL